MDIRLHVEIPQLTTLGDRIMAGLATITDALNDLEATLDTELTEIAAALQAASGTGSPTQEEVDAVATRVLALKDRIQAIIP
jgi:hypothetical protein